MSLNKLLILRTAYRSSTALKNFNSVREICCCSNNSAEKTIRVLVTGAAGQIAYSIIPRLARGDPFPPNTNVELKLIDRPETERIMQGVNMEVADSAFKACTKSEVFTDPMKAYSNVDLVVMLASAKLQPGGNRFDLLKDNYSIYQNITDIMRSTANSNTRIVVVANPANTNALFLAEKLKGIVPSKNISSLSRLDHNRSQHMLASKLGVKPYDIRKIIVWGNHADTMVPDITQAEVFYKDKGWVKVNSVFNDEKWFKDVFTKNVIKRGWDIVKYRGNSSALSAAAATIQHISNFYVDQDTKNDWKSLGVYTQSSGYDCIPDGIVFSHPCYFENGEYKIVQGLEIDPYIRKMIQASVKDCFVEKTYLKL